MGLAIVTGASRGIGRAIAIQLAVAGYTVACLARSEADLQTLASTSPRLVPVAVDLTDPEALQAAVEPLLAAHGRCEVLINNAGFGLRAAVEEIPMDRFRRQMELNVFSCISLIQMVLPGMRAARDGCIVNISSVAGRISTPFGGAYCATKFALEAVSDALRVEMKPWNVRVVLIEPGPVETNFMQAANAESDDILDASDSPYSAGYSALRAQIGELHSSAWPVQDVADIVMEAVQSREPASRYGAHSLLLRMAMGLRDNAPGVFDKLIARRMGLNRRIKG